MFYILEGKLKERNFTRAKLAKELGMAISTISQKLNGRATISLPEAMRIKMLLGTELTIDELFSINKTG